MYYINDLLLHDQDPLNLCVRRPTINLIRLSHASCQTWHQVKDNATLASYNVSFDDSSQLFNFQCINFMYMRRSQKFVSKFISNSI